MSDNLTAIREAISAAAESVSSLSMNKDLPQNDEDENFLVRCGLLVKFYQLSMSFSIFKI